MNLKIYATKAFVQALKEHRYPRVVLEKIHLLALNPRHPSLKAHQVGRAHKDIWECYASDEDRILYEFKSGELYLWYLGSRALIAKVHYYRFDPEQTFYEFVTNFQNFNNKEANADNAARYEDMQVVEQRTAYITEPHITGATVPLTLPAHTTSTLKQQEVTNEKDLMALYRKIKPRYSALSQKLADL